MPFTRARFALAPLLLAAAAACTDRDGPAENLGERIDDAAGEARERIDDAGDRLEEAGDEAGATIDEIRDALQDN